MRETPFLGGREDLAVHRSGQGLFSATCNVSNKRRKQIDQNLLYIHNHKFTFYKKQLISMMFI